jgi:zinc protease
MIPILAILIAGAPPADSTVAYTVNGVQVIQRIDTTTKLMAVGVYFLGGTRILTPANAGIEDLYFRAAERGSKNYPRGTGARALARTGSFVWMNVGEDWTTLWLEGFAADIDSTWAVVADEIVNPTLSDTAVGLSRDELLAAARGRAQDPQERLAFVAESVMFAGHPYEVDPRGNPESITSLSADKLRDFQHREIVASRILLVVAGNVTREHLTALVQSTLGTLPVGSYHWSLPPALPYREGRARWIKIHEPLQTNYILGYCAGPEPGSPLYWPFRMANSIYAGWVFDDVRKKGWSYAAGAPYLDRALPVGGLEMSTNTPDQAVIAAMTDLQDMVDLDFGGDGVASEGSDAWVFWTRRTRRDYRVALYEAETTVSGTVAALAKSQLLFGSYRNLDAFTPSRNAFDDRTIANASALCRTHMEFAYLGDTTKMKGKWPAP